MKPNRAVWALLLIFAFSGVQAQKKLSVKEVRAKLEMLNARCEAAREEKLAPLRKQYIDECISKWGKEPDHCERFYANYGDRSGNRPPLFRDLPECVEAFEFQKSHRER